MNNEYKTATHRSPEDNLKEVWIGEDQDECVSICERFKAAKIPFRVIQHQQQFLKRVDRSFKIGVPPSLYAQAKEIITKGRLDFSDENSDQRVMELPADFVDRSGTQENRRLRDDGAQHPNVQIWSEKTNQLGKMIESSLRENNIPVRVELLANGFRTLFVMPVDSARAREIIYEIKTGTPPKQ